MSALPRLTFAMFVLAAAAAPAVAQSPKQRADALNDEGKQMLQAKPMRAAEASEKFRQAIVLVPDGGYYYNLCMSLYHEGKLSEALTACRAVEPNGGNAQAIKQANTIMDLHIKPKMIKAGVDPDAPPPPEGGGGGGGGGGGTGGGTGGGGTGGDTGGGGTGGDTGGGGTGQPPPPQPVVVAPPPSLFTQTAPPGHDYTWTLGGQLVAGSAAFGRADAYANAVGGFRLTGDYRLVPAAGFGLQGYLGYVGAGEKDLQDTLNVFDLGLAGYIEKCRGRACIKPLVGLHFGLFQTGSMEAAGGDVQMTAGGARLELGGEYALGTRYEHIITVGLAAHLYSKVVGQYDSDPEYYGLDKPSRAVLFGIGYTHRFNTPLGSSPFFTLQ